MKQQKHVERTYHGIPIPEYKSSEQREFIYTLEEIYEIHDILRLSGLRPLPFCRFNSFLKTKTRIELSKIKRDILRDRIENISYLVHDPQLKLDL